MERTFQQYSNLELIKELRELVETEKSGVIKQIKILQEMRDRNIHQQAGYPSLIDFCVEKLGMTRNQAWKRSSVAYLASAYPETIDLLSKGETNLSCLVGVAAKITPANSDDMLAGIRGKSRRQVEAFLSTIQPDGSYFPGEARVKLSVDVPPTLLEKLEKARTLLRQNKTSVSLDEVLDQALEALLDKRDPVRKAQRAKRRLEKKQLASQPTSPGKLSATGSKAEPTSPGKPRPRYIPAQVRHEVITRDSYQCSFVADTGHRCSATTGLQLDHRKMFCQGGGHEPGNLRLLCPAHNRYLAGETLGHGFMMKKIVANR